MPSHPRLSIVPRDPTAPVPSLSMPELSMSLAQIWDRWHPIDPAIDGRWPWRDDELDRRIRDLAWQTIERVWDETTSLGRGTGEVVDFAMFPSPLEGYWLRQLAPVG